jgi:hypothetical protein
MPYPSPLKEPTTGKVSWVCCFYTFSFYIFDEK